MGALIAFLPQILSLINNPAVQALLPLLQQLLAQVGTGAFPNVDPARAGEAAVSLFDAEHIKWVQTALRILGKDVTVDGILGDGAKAAVSAFQSENGLVADGWPGPLTNEALRKKLLALRVAK
jgi:peptidoglycan hydrolase-like protein with peptidoglycan-binding domain